MFFQMMQMKLFRKKAASSFCSELWQHFPDAVRACLFVLSVCLFVCLFPVCFLFVRLLVGWFVFVVVLLSVCRLVCLSVVLSVCLSVCLSVFVRLSAAAFLSVFGSVRLFVCWFVRPLFVCLFLFLFSVCRLVCLSVCVVCLSVGLCLFVRFSLSVCRFPVWSSARLLVGLFVRCLLVFVLVVGSVRCVVGLSVCLSFCLCLFACPHGVK